MSIVKNEKCVKYFKGAHCFQLLKINPNKTEFPTDEELWAGYFVSKNAF